MYRTNLRLPHQPRGPASYLGLRAGWAYVDPQPSPSDLMRGPMPGHGLITRKALGPGGAHPMAQFTYVWSGPSLVCSQLNPIVWVPAATKNMVFKNDLVF